MADLQLFVKHALRYILYSAEASLSLVTRLTRLELRALTTAQSETNTRPLQPVQQKTTLDRYAGVLRDFVVFLLRSYTYQGQDSPSSEAYRGLYTISPDVVDMINEFSAFLCALTKKSR